MKRCKYCREKIVGNAHKKFCSSKCYQRWYRANVRKQAKKKGREFCRCGCGKKLIGCQTMWHSQNCRSRWVNATRPKSTSKSKMVGNDYGTKNKGKSHAPSTGYRYPWIIDYCYQGDRQCKKYHFHPLMDMNEIYINCFGRKYTKGVECYE